MKDANKLRIPEKCLNYYSELLNNNSNTNDTKLSLITEHTEQCRTEEKSRMKWIKFQERKRRWVLDQKLEKTIRERDELEIMKIKLNQQRQEADKKHGDFKILIMTVAKIKATLEKTAVEIKTTSEEIFRAQRKMESNSEDIKQHKVSYFCFLWGGNLCFEGLVMAAILNPSKCLPANKLGRKCLFLAVFNSDHFETNIVVPVFKSA